MTQTAYSPMHRPEKGLTQEDMWTTLAKHAQSEVQIHLQKVGETPKAELRIREPMVWQKPVRTGDNAGYVLSQCGRFSISKDCVCGAPMYMAWRRRDPPHTSKNLGVRLTLIEAQHLCELESERE